MINADKPIFKIEEDILGRTEFARNLANTILTYEAENSIVLGLYGRWGSGKSSLVNLVYYFLLQNELKLNRENIIINYNPWNISGQNQLLSEFFSLIQESIPESKNKKISNLGELLQVYSLLLNAASIHPEFGIPALISGKIMEFFGRRIGLNRKKLDKYSNESLKTIKDKITNELLKIDKKIVIFIDDIDRLNKSEIRLIFQLTKAIADFPNVVYLLSFDRDIVAEALKDEQGKNGLEYLEKIVQIPFPIPEVEIGKIHTFFFSKVDKIISPMNDEDFDKLHWSKMFYNGISSYLRNIRDVIRITNSFSFKYALIKDEVCFVDLLGLIILEIYEPDIFNEIKNNKNLFLAINHGLEDNGDEKIRNFINVVLESSRISNKDAVKNLLCELFPEVGKTIEKWRYGNHDKNYKRKYSLICCEECFDTYFKLSIGDKIVSRSFVNEFLYNSNLISTQEMILATNKEEKLDSFLNSITALTPDLKSCSKVNERVAVILEAFFQIWNQLDDPGIKLFISVPFIWRLLNISEGLLKVVTYDEREKIIKEILFNRSIPLYLRVSQLLSLEREHGRFTDNKDYHGEVLISLESVINMEEEIYSEIKERSDNHDDFELLDTLYFWKNKNQDEMVQFMKDVIASDVGLIKGIAHFVGVGKASGDYVYQIYTFHKQSFEEYYSIKDAYERLKSIIEKINVKDYVEDEIKKILMFIQAVEKNNFESVSLKEIEKTYYDFFLNDLT